MIPSSACQQWLADLPGPCRRARPSAGSYTITRDTIPFPEAGCLICEAAARGKGREGRRSYCRRPGHWTSRGPGSRTPTGADFTPHRRSPDIGETTAGAAPADTITGAGYLSVCSATARFAIATPRVSRDTSSFSWGGEGGDYFLALPVAPPALPASCCFGCCVDVPLSPHCPTVMAGLDPAIHAMTGAHHRQGRWDPIGMAWITGSGPVMTVGEHGDGRVGKARQRFAHGPATRGQRAVAHPTLASIHPGDVQKGLPVAHPASIRPYTSEILRKHSKVVTCPP